MTLSAGLPFSTCRLVLPYQSSLRLRKGDLAELALNNSLASISAKTRLQRAVRVTAPRRHTLLLQEGEQAHEHEGARAVGVRGAGTSQGERRFDVRGFIVNFSLKNALLQDGNVENAAQAAQTAGAYGKQQGGNERG